MPDYINSEGASANNYSSADYTGNFFSYTVDGQYDAYYITRYAIAADHATASLTDNTAFLYGSAAADQININAAAIATEGASAYSYGNEWSIDFGDGDDRGVIHTLASGIGAGTVVTIDTNMAILDGGAGSDVLHARQVVSALDGAFVAITGAARFIRGGDGLDFINTQLTLESGNSSFAGGSASYSFNNLHVNGGAAGADIQATAFVTSYGGGTIDAVGNSFSFRGSTVNAGTSIEAGNASLAGGSINYSGNDITAMTDAGGGTIFAQNFLSAAQGGFINFSDNVTILPDRDGADFISAGIGFTAQSGGSGVILHNSIFAGGGAGNDTIDLFLLGSVDAGGAANISENYFYAEGADGDDILSLNWRNFSNDGFLDFSLNTAELTGGAGSDTITAHLGEAVTQSSISLSGGDGDDFIQSSDVGQNNERLISGGAGNDTIVDDIGFSTVVFEGAFADYTLTALSGGWISITDNRDGAPDGTDQLYQVDQLRFGDGDVLVADLGFPIEGTEGGDILIGSDGDDDIYGHGGDDSLSGRAGDDVLDGGTGNDVLFGQEGDDRLSGSQGNDQLIGNGGADQLTGGAGADRFIFGALFQSTVDAPDLITDFSGAVVLGTNGQGNVIRTPGQRDTIDLSLMDANVNLEGDQSFTLVQHGFSGSAGEVYSSYDATTGITSLYLDVNGDAAADMTIQLLGQVNLTGADFLF